MTIPNGHKKRLGAAIEDYLTRLDSGERPDTDEYLARYPDCADGLRRFFNDLAYVDDKLAEEKTVSRETGLGQWFADTGSLERWDPSVLAGRVDLPRIRGFHVLEELGGGSQGVVYKAVQLGTKRTVALKVIREGAFATKAERRRFENEVELASRLNHPNIVAVYSCGQDAGRDYFAMEYIEGQALDLYLATQTLDIPATLELFLQVCDAVGCAHRYGVIHRDLKPSNIIVDSSDHARIVDFGLAKARLQEAEDEHVAATRVGEFAGTWVYASPEQARRDPGLIDVRTDVYALGVILYEMLTDCLPYPIRDEPRDVIAKHILETPPIRPCTIRRDIDDEMDTILLRALAKELERRYQSVDALSEDLRRYLAGEAIEAKRDSSWYVLRKYMSRHRWQVGTTAVALAALITFAVTISVLYSQAVSARATTKVRSDVVRQSQRYIMDKLDEFSRVGNTLTEIAAAHPELPEIRVLSKERYEDSFSLFGRIVTGIPDPLLEAVSDAADPDHDVALRWLAASEDELAYVEERSGTHRFVFRVAKSSATDFARRDRPGPVGHVVKLCEALAARGVHQCRAGHHDAAIASLEAARLAAKDLADSRKFVHKVYSVLARSPIYDAVLLIFGELGDDTDPVQPYIRWVLRDPPLPEYRLAMAAELHKRSQFVAAASRGTGRGDQGYVDLDALDRSSGGMVQPGEGLTPELRTLAQSLTPESMLETLDAYIREVEKWDEFPLKVLQERARNVSMELQSYPASPLCRPLLSTYLTPYQVRGQVRAKRAATILAARLCQHRARAGRWPDKLGEAFPEGKRIDTVDPYLGLPFGYKLQDGKPHLYSVNEDENDDNGKEGAWGQPGTDVVFFVGPPD